MSIENSLERIATALEKLSNVPTLNSVATVGTDAQDKPKAPPKPPKADKPVAPPKPDTPAITVQQLNDILVEEFHRLGDNRTPIDACMKALGAASVTTLKPEQYEELIAAVRAVEA